MRRFILLFQALFTFLACAAAPTLNVYTYDSFASQSGMGKVVRETCDPMAGVKANLVSFGSAGEALNQVALEGKKTRADVLVGVDQGMLARARKLELFERLSDVSAPRVPKSLFFDDSRSFIPFDYGYLTLVYDKARGTRWPAGLTLRELARKPEFRKKVVIEDPRTSSIGFAFLLWTKAIGGEKDFAPFWNDLSRQIVTVSPGWSGAYGLFLKKEADFVVSYTTSPAYHREHEKNESITAASFPEGHYRQIEGAGILKTSKQGKAARKWIECLLSESVQKAIPTRQWMYPAREGVDLPASFKGLPKIGKTLTVDAKLVGEHSADWVRQWTLLMTKSR